MTGSRRPARHRAAKKGIPAGAGKAAGTAAATGRKGKFNASGRHVDGQWCASAAEAERYEQLLRLALVGAIEEIECQPKFDLVVNNKHITQYRADFRYRVVDERGNVLAIVIEDIKGFSTPEFEIKHALFDALVTPALTIIRPGQVKGARDLFMRQHWDGVVPMQPGDWKVPDPKASQTFDGAKREDYTPQH